MTRTERTKMNIDEIKKEILEEFQGDMIEAQAETAEFISVITIDYAFQCLKGAFEKIGERNYTRSEIVNLLDSAYIESRNTIAQRMRKEIIEKNS